MVQTSHPLYLLMRVYTACTQGFHPNLPGLHAAHAQKTPASLSCTVIDRCMLLFAACPGETEEYSRPAPSTGRHLASSSSSCRLLEKPCQKSEGLSCCQPYSWCRAPQRDWCIHKPLCMLCGLYAASVTIDLLLNASVRVVLLPAQVLAGRYDADGILPNSIRARAMLCLE